MSAVSSSYIRIPPCCRTEDISRVLMLRRKARPTETELHVQYSHMINEALEMVAVDKRPGDSTRSLIPSMQSDDTQV